MARRAGVPVVSGISCSFGCPFEGDVPVAHLESVVARLVDMGARGIGLADTTGMANPAQVGRVLERLVPRFPGVEWTLHTHDTRAMAIPNILAAMEYGVTHFDASIGGLGGCPFAPGASGNVCTEDLIHCLHAMGVETGVDLDALIEASKRVQEIVGRGLPGQLVKAGKWDRRYPAPRRGARAHPRARMTKTATAHAAIDGPCRHRWTFPVIGREKGRVLRRLLLKHQPRRGIEVGSLSATPPSWWPATCRRGGRLTCVEQNPYLAKFVEYNVGARGPRPAREGRGGRRAPRAAAAARPGGLPPDRRQEGGLPRLPARGGAAPGQGRPVVADNTGMFRRDVKPYLDHVRAGGRYESREHDFGFDCMEVSVFRG